MDWRTATNEDALKAWDAGDTVWTCELGGLGPGYEQCIQLMGFEMFRAMLANPTDWTLMQEDKDAWEKYRNLIEAVPAVKKLVSELGPSGAQFGAAMNIASVFTRRGYSGGMKLVPKDRRILVSKKFPAIAE